MCPVGTGFTVAYTMFIAHKYYLFATFYSLDFGPYWNFFNYQKCYRQ